MNYYILVFASRNESMNFSNLLKNYGVNNSLVSTPREAMVGCGLSVKVDSYAVDRAKSCLNICQYKSTYKGLFRVEKIGIHLNVKRVI